MNLLSKVETFLEFSSYSSSVPASSAYDFLVRSLRAISAAPEHVPLVYTFVMCLLTALMSSFLAVSSPTTLPAVGDEVTGLVTPAASPDVSPSFYCSCSCSCS